MIDQLMIMANDEGFGVAQEICSHAANVYSQFGEDGILKALFVKIGVENEWCFECGAANGIFMSNTRNLVNDGWLGILMEDSAVEFALLEANSPTTQNIHATLSHKGKYTLDKILEAKGAPIDIDLVSIDVDGQDFYILNAMIRYRPRVIVIEHNPLADPDFIPEPDGEGQAGGMAIRRLLAAKGYWTLCQTHSNTIAVRGDIADTFLKGNDNDKA